MDMGYQRLRAVADELERLMPNEAKGLEIGAGQIVMTVSPSRAHDMIAFKIQNQLMQQVPSSLAAVAAADVEDKILGRLRSPDVLVVDYEALDEDTMEPLHPSDVRLAVEIVSPSNPLNDYVEKMHDYPAMGIPIYLLVDPRKGRLEVHSEPGAAPDGPKYHRTYEYTFGAEVPVGDWVVDSTTFRRYPKS
jgi:Uma2 family endonuclease